MADIGKAAGLLKGSVYHHFPSKEAILVGAVERLSDFFKDGCFAIAYDESKSEMVRLNEMVDQIEAYFLEHRTCVMAHLSVEGLDDMPDANDRVISFFGAWRDTFAHVLTPHYGKEQAIILSEDAISQLEGAVVMLNIFDNVGSLTRACKHIRGLL